MFKSIPEKYNKLIFDISVAVILHVIAWFVNMFSLLIFITGLHLLYCINQKKYHEIFKYIPLVSSLIIPLGYLSGTGYIFSFFEMTLVKSTDYGVVTLLMLSAAVGIVYIYWIRMHRNDGSVGVRSVISDDSISWDDDGMRTLDDYRKSVDVPACGIPLGWDDCDTPLVKSICDMPHLLIAGSTGMGKSNMLKAIIEVQPENSQILIIDTKREMSMYKGRSGVGVKTDYPEIASSLKKLTSVMDKRYMEREQGIDSHNPVLCVVDEYGDLMTADKPYKDGIEKSIMRLAQTGRGAGIHLVVATQYPTSDILDSAIKMNCNDRICFKVPTVVNSKAVIDHEGAESLRRKGQAVYYSPDGLREIQTPYVG